MLIKSVAVSGLLGRRENLTLSFNDDLNILTGRNGSGKTSLMKLVWFIMSGNIILALREVNFRSVTIETSEYTVSVHRTGPVHCKIELSIGGEVHFIEDDAGEPDEEPFFESAEDKADPIIMAKGASIFFPTFRRIEGGFSMTSGRNARNRNALRTEMEIDDSLNGLSKKLSNAGHLFVAAISSQDIVSLLLRRYATFSEEVNKFQGAISKEVIEKIRHYESIEGSKQTAEALLSETRADIEKIETFREETMKPLDAVKVLVERLFKHSGITFDKRLNFGIAADAVSSDVLSAGEKQMLSFICYNAFFKDTVIFIDEPELSLHVDWQRQLFGILEGQGSGNQFILATHSPFIYGKYPDKEVSISADRGE